jgi:hypothetical protein
MLPGIFQKIIFSRACDLAPSIFMRPIHPKTEIRPTADSIRKILEAGWVGQLKIHGHRAQIHLPSSEVDSGAADSEDDVLVYNRQGQLHKKVLPPRLLFELQRIYTPSAGWNVIDAEWIKSDDRIFVFDFLKREGQTLHRLNFQERWKRLPRAYVSPLIQTLPVLTDLDVMAALVSGAEGISFHPA